MGDVEVAMVESVVPSNEGTPLLPRNGNDGGDALINNNAETSWRHSVFAFLEAKTKAGLWYERFMIGLILTNVAAFVLGSLFVPEYNDQPWAQRHTGICSDWCDALFFGNFADNPLQILNIGSTSVLELVTIAVFTVEYILRLALADLEDPKYAGFMGRIRWIPTFFSAVDIASTLPFYIDAFFLRDTDLVATSFVRMFRLFRMMRVEGRYDSALSMIDDAYAAQKGVIGTALFVGCTVWMTVSSLYYIVERKNLDMIYCGGAKDCPDDIDTSLCTIDHWGFTDCGKAGCPGTEENSQPCYNLYSSIPMASYYALLNLFGEFPLIDQHSNWGQVVGTFTAVVAVAVFALPAGIIGNGLEDVIDERRTNTESGPIVEPGALTTGFLASDATARGRWYNFLHGHTSTQAKSFDFFINTLIVLTALSFAMDTLADLPAHVHIILDSFELISVSIFTVEYLFRVYAAKEDPKYQKVGGRWAYMQTFLAGIDFLSVAPYWAEVCLTGRVITPYSDSSSVISNSVKALRLLRLFRFERYTHAFTSFDDVIMRNSDILSITLYSALMVWVLFASILWLTERDNPDAEMSENYKTVPHAMWLTLLNLSGEAPLSQYSAIGKVVTGICGLFATAIFGIPIGLLGSGFEEVLEEETEDNLQELQAAGETNGAQPSGDALYRPIDGNAPLGSPLEQTLYKFVNGMGSKAATYFELSIYGLIFATIAVGCYQTIDGHENDFHEVEWVAVIVFTVEYLFRFIGAAADPEFSNGNNPMGSRLRFIFSFYSIVDLLAIVPFYLVLALPNSIVDRYDEYLRMLRILRLVKLDKYVPSLTLIDDVIRLKYDTLRVAGYAAITLWVVFSGAMFLCEHTDFSNDIDPVPDYGCNEDCTMTDRFQNFFDSLVYTGIHLTGDYPIITYNWPARFVNFFMVIAAVGVVSIPSGVIASGFVQIVQSKNKKKRRATEQQHDEGWQAGDDWYEVRYRELQGVPPPPSPFGPKVDEWQVAVNEFLNGREVSPGGRTVYTNFAFGSRIFIFLVIIGNILAVLLESVPTIDRAVGNEPGNFFDVFEAFSVMVFALEYFLRLFCAPKNREALYSSWTYATTFFGIVDLLSTAPWFVQQRLLMGGIISPDDDNARIFRIFRIFRILQLEDFVTAFSKLDNVFRASKDVLKATGLLALVIWVGCGALFYIFEENNPNWRECDASVPLSINDTGLGCYDFKTTAECNEQYPGLCSQKAFVDMPNSLYYTAVFLGGEWGVVDFTWPGRFVCLFLCVVGIGLYAIPIGSLFDSFGAVLGFEEEEEEEEGDE